MASRAQGFCKQASGCAAGEAVCAAADAAADALPLAAPLGALQAWLADVSPSCGLPSAVGPREEGPEHAVGGAFGDSAYVYGELSLPALATLLFEHAADCRRPGAAGLTFADLGSGTGKSLLLAALCPFVSHAIGIELVPSRHACAVALAERFERTLLASARPAGGVRLSLRCGSFLDDDAATWRDADVVLCNCLLFPDATLAALSPKLAALRPGALVATVAAPLRCAALRLLRVRHVRCSWGTEDLLLYRVMQEGPAWQRRPPGCKSPADVAHLAAHLRAAGVLRALRLPGETDAADATADAKASPAASLLIVGCGDSDVAAHLARRCGAALRVHACDLDDDAIARQRQRCSHATGGVDGAAVPLFAVADVRDLPLDAYAWRPDGAQAAADVAAAAEDSSSEDEDADVVADVSSPPLFDALLDMGTLDALAALSGGRTLLHGALCSLAACLAPGGVAVLLSRRPPAQALPLLTCHTALRWRVRCEAAAADAAESAFTHLYRCERAPDDDVVALCAAWCAANDDAGIGTPRCSLAAAGKHPFPQRWWECASCVAEAVCAVCAATCHAGHVGLAPAPPPRRSRGAHERGFCDCGFSGRCAACGVPPLTNDADAPLPLP